MKMLRGTKNRESNLSPIAQVLLDRRNDASTTDAMFDAICDHVKFTTNDGALRWVLVLRTIYKGKEPNNDTGTRLYVQLAIEPQNDINKTGLLRDECPG